MQAHCSRTIFVDISEPDVFLRQVTDQSDGFSHLEIVRIFLCDHLIFNRDGYAADRVVKIGDGVHIDGKVSVYLKSK